MASVNDIYRLFDQFAPFKTQMDFDNAGLLVGDRNGKVSKVLLSLDITLPVIEEAVAWGSELIVSPHPVIFNPVKSVLAGDPTGDKLMALIRNNISAICAHTNLDVAVGGVNDALAAALELENVEVFLPEGTDEQGRPYGLGCVGTTGAPCDFIAFAEKVKKNLKAEGLRFVDSGRKIHRVAVGGGACGSCLHDAWKMGCDVLVTSDVKYDVFLDAKALGISLIDAGHFSTENVVLPVMEEIIKNSGLGVEVRTSTAHKEVFSYL